MPAASKAWADDGVRVFAIGITNGISRQGLIDIAGAEERVLQVENFDAIAALAKSLLHKVCTPGNLHAIVKQSVFTLFCQSVYVCIRAYSALLHAF